MDEQTVRLGADDDAWVMASVRRTGWDVMCVGDPDSMHAGDVIIVLDRDVNGSFDGAVVLRRRTATGSEEDHE